MTRVKKILLIAGILGIIVAGIFYFRHLEVERKKFKVVFMDVGQGDAALIQFENGERMLVDCGKDRTVLSALGRNLVFYDRKIDYLLVTHPDLDHYGGCIDVLKNYQVKKVLVNGDDKKGDPFYTEWKTMLLKQEVQVVSASSALKISSARFKFYLPDKSLKFEKPDTNNNSVVFTFGHLGKSFLFTGDMGIEAEKLLQNKYCTGAEVCPFRAKVLKVAHHGSDGSSGEDFLSLIHPDVAVISVGKNSFGHPSLRTLRHLERVNAKIFRTDEIGDVVIE